MNIYYKIWGDVLCTGFNNPAYKNDWKFYSMYIMTMLLSFNILTIMMWLGYYDIFSLPDFDIDIFPGTMLDSVTKYLISFGIPSMLISYFTVFYKDEYKIIMKGYKGKKGQYLLPYLFITVAVLMLPLLIMLFI